MATETLRPNAAGDETSIDSQEPDSGSHYDKVDEAVADDETTYIYHDTTSYLRDLYNLPASSGSGTINFIKIYIRCTKLGSNGRAKPSLKSNSTVTDGTEVTPDDYESWSTHSQQWDTNPADGEAWEWADIDALQIGVALKAHGPGQDTACTQVYVEVDYTAVTYEDLAGVSAGVASVSGSVIRDLALSGSSAGVGGVLGFIAIKRALAGLSQGVGSVSGFIAVKRALSGISSGIASVSGTLEHIVELSGISAGIASVSGKLGFLRALAGISTGKASVIGSIRISIELSGLSAGVATVSGSLSRWRLAIRNLAAVRNLSPFRVLDKIR